MPKKPKPKSHGSAVAAYIRVATSGQNLASQRKGTHFFIAPIVLILVFAITEGREWRRWQPLSDVRSGNENLLAGRATGKAEELSTGWVV